ncbi:N-acetylmuramoyl-L-alanine amidase family protein [Aminirod propionatiphilus]|uniref:N-acetylmuramoyl-L-alanine amidase n=1 Tax=Aminirod propionatiphilus TaxID=3415223 RepID=A0ACD1DYF2_9BACT|nr:N-acetylmuramoyl-L-alanine amidase [Synergistota bacterium]
MTGKICLDPGHGGRDPGAVGNGWRESDVVLDIALKAESLLQALGFSVAMTRRSDQFVELYRRADFATTTCATLFVSIHANAAASTDACGTEVFHYAGSTLGGLLAQSIYAELRALEGLRGRGIKTADFCVLRRTRCPAVLVETAFITNRTDDAWADEGYLVTERGRLAMAGAVARGIKAYLK